MKLEEILEYYGEEVLDKYYELFPDKDLTKFGDRFCGRVGDYEDFVLDCYYSTGSDELDETLTSFESGVFQEYYYYDENTGTAFVFYND
jgi:hypothetical protein